MAQSISGITYEVFKSYGVPLTEEIILSVKEIVTKKSPVNPDGLTFIIARNKAISLIRKRKTESKKALRNLLAEEKKEKSKAFFQKAKKDFCFACLISFNSFSFSKEERRRRDFEAIFNVLFLGHSRIDERKRLNISKPLFNKRWERAMKDLLPHASPLLRHFFLDEVKNKKTKTKTGRLISFPDRLFKGQKSTLTLSH
jgi:hypothetical protein